MKERIESLIRLIKSGMYDQEDAHGLYDSLLEDFIRNIGQQDESNIVLMKELIDLPKDFWYA